MTPSLGIEQGGLHCAEALLIARYFMYAQVYLHRVRRSYDIHLRDFLRDWLQGGCFSPEIESLLCMTDNEVLAGMALARRCDLPGKKWAERIMGRGHYRVLYESDPIEAKRNPNAVVQVYEKLKGKFNEDEVRMDSYVEKGSIGEFPVLMHNSQIVPSSLLSLVVTNLPLAAIECVFVAPEILCKARRWFKKNKEDIVRLEGEETNE